MEPTNHPFRKENDLNQTSMIMCKMLIFRGVPFSEGDWIPMDYKDSRLQAYLKNPEFHPTG